MYISVVKQTHCQQCCKSIRTVYDSILFFFIRICTNVCMYVYLSFNQKLTFLSGYLKKKNDIIYSQYTVHQYKCTYSVIEGFIHITNHNMEGPLKSPLRKIRPCLFSVRRAMCFTNCCVTGEAGRIMPP